MKISKLIIRFCDLILSVVGLLFCLPFFIAVSILILIDSRGGIFYLQERVGKEGALFKLFKFRTMRPDSDKKGLLTVGKDNRITRVGGFLRKYKLDELPQLINVLKGEMSFVGPRPEVKRYVDLYTEEQRKILDLKPGITDYASIKYYDENEFLGKSIDPEKTYIEEIMPEKLNLNMTYKENFGIFSYMNVIFKTICKILC